MKAIILSAGFGTRLRPLTNYIPKPLIPVGAISLLEFHIRKLVSFGIKDIVINSHHLSGSIKSFIGRTKIRGVKLHFLYEKKILGTGGAIKNAQRLLGQEPFIVVNADIIHDLDINAVLQKHIKSNAIATMAIRNTNKEKYQRILIDKGGNVISIGKPAKRDKGKKRHLFTGIHIIDPEIFSFIPKGKYSCINASIYSHLIAKGKKIRACKVTGYWKDIGTIDSYLGSVRDFLKGNLPKEFYKGISGKLISKKCQIKNKGFSINVPVYIDPNVEISQNACIGPNAIILKGAQVKDGAKIKNSLLLNNARINKDELIEDSICYKRIFLKRS